MDSDYCTICEKNVNFIPKRSRTKCSCPGCGSKERHRLIALYLKEYKILNNEKKILNLFPEKCLSQIYKKYDNYTCGDLNPSKNMKKHHPNIKTIDMTNINYPDNSFHLIQASHVLEHVIDDISALNELYRVLTKGGTLLLLFPLNARNYESDENYSYTMEEKKKILWTR